MNNTLDINKKVIHIYFRASRKSKFIICPFKKKYVLRVYVVVDTFIK